MSIDSIGGAVSASMAMEQASLSLEASTSMQKKSMDFQADIASKLLSSADGLKEQVMQAAGKGQKLDISI